MNPDNTALGCRILLCKIAHTIVTKTRRYLVDLQRERLPSSETVKQAATDAAATFYSFEPLVLAKQEFWSVPELSDVKRLYKRVERLLTAYDSMIRQLDNAAKSCKNVPQAKNAIKRAHSNAGQIITKAEKIYKEAAQSCDTMRKNIPSKKKGAKSRIFIGSAGSSLPTARAIKSHLDTEFDIEVWNESPVFSLGTATIEALEAAVLTYDFGIFVFTPDDKATVKGVEVNVTRDNVIFEAGLFMGKLGRFKAFVVRPRDVEVALPSDLKAMQVALYDSKNSNLKAAVGTACNEIRGAIQKALC